MKNKIIYLLIISITILFTNNSSYAFTAHQWINISANAANTRNLLYTLAKHTHKNIVISDKITGIISVQLKQITWREGLDLVLQMENLEKHEDNKNIFITPSTDFNNPSQLASPQIINMHYAEANDIAKILKPTGILSANGNASSDTRTNSLVIVDTKKNITSVKKIIDKLDAPEKQIEIEARIVSVDENFVRDLGVIMGTSQNNSGNDANTDDTDQTTIQPGTFNFTLGTIKNGTIIDLELQALESEGHGKIISSPRLVTTNREPAYIESGSEIPYQEKTKSGNTSIAFKKAVLSLKVTPEIISDNQVNLILQLNQDKISNLNVNGVPAIDTRQIQTQILAKNNQTIILGGIYEWSKSKNQIQVPILSKIPILGGLFRSQEIRNKRQELLMFITPRIK